MKIEAANRLQAAAGNLLQTATHALALLIDDGATVKLISRSDTKVSVIVSGSLCVQHGFLKVIRQFSEELCPEIKAIGVDKFQIDFVVE